MPTVLRLTSASTHASGQHGSHAENRRSGRIRLEVLKGTFESKIEIPDKEPIMARESPICAVSVLASVSPACLPLQ
jgi:hypothetical protein